MDYRTTTKTGVYKTLERSRGHTRLLIVIIVIYDKTATAAARLIQHATHVATLVSRARHVERNKNNEQCEPSQGKPAARAKRTSFAVRATCVSFGETGRAGARETQNKARELRNQWRPLCVGRAPRERARLPAAVLFQGARRGPGYLHMTGFCATGFCCRSVLLSPTCSAIQLLRRWPNYDVKDGKNYPNANSCLMFTFSVVVLHWDGRSASRRCRPPPTAHDAAVARATGPGAAGRRMRGRTHPVTSRRYHHRHGRSYTLFAP